MQTTDLKVLLIEDNPGDAFLIKFYLEEFTAVSYDLSHAERMEEAAALLDKESFDIILLDLDLPDSYGTDTLKNLLEQYPGNLVIVMTGLTDESIGIETVKMGAQDFLVKGRFDGKVLNSALRYAFERFQLSKQLKSYTSELDFSKSRLDEIQVVADLGYFEYRIKENHIYLSDKFNEVLDISFPNNQMHVDEFTLMVNESSDFKNLIEVAGRSMQQTKDHYTLKSAGKKVTVFLKPFAAEANSDGILVGAVQLTDGH